jgi:hypothetical protein
MNNMDTEMREEVAVTSSRQESPAAPKFSIGLLVLVFLLNAILGMAVVLSLGQLRGVNLLTVLVLLFWTGVSLTLWASHQILLAAIRALTPDAELGVSSGLFQLFRHEWKLLRDGFPTNEALTHRQLFVATLRFVLIYVGVCVVLCMEGDQSWPKITPFVDVVIAVFGAGVLLRILPVGQIRLRRVFQIIGDVIHLPSTFRIRWALLIAGNLFTTAYGLVVVLPFVTAHECPLALAFLVLSVVPLSILGISVVMLLLPALAVLNDHAATTNSDS